MHHLPRANIPAEAAAKSDAERWRQGLWSLNRAEKYRVQIAVNGHDPHDIDPTTGAPWLHGLIALTMPWAMWWGPRDVRWTWPDETTLEARRADGSVAHYALAELITTAGCVDEVAIEVLLRIRDAIDAENRRAAGDGDGWARALGLVS